ncbi:MAG: MiaB/RimO family radical SAM methylthiotransferase [bacterium]|nr:MiaB/RimO family radical SAM methylthiotransferase [bacterium]
MMDFSSFYIETLGCPKNEVDSRIISKRLKLQGKFPASSKEAEVIIINSCGFLQEAIGELKERVSYWRRRKKKVLITGCAVERYGNDFLKEKDVELAKIDTIAGEGRENKCLKQTILPNFENQDFSKVTLSHYVKVQEGCIRKCSYCVISKIRGPLRSRPINDIVKEIAYLRDIGVKEFVLIAQDLTLYGADIGVNLLSLLERLPVGPYYRLMYLHPHGINEKLIRLIREIPGILPYLHVPIQHVSDRVLKSMKRAGGERSVKRAIELVRKYLPGFFIRVDIMVGYPLEGEQDFELLINFLEKEKPERIAIFKYSHEPSASSYTLNDLEPEIKDERYEIAYQVAYEVMGKVQEGLKGKSVLAFYENGEGWTQYDAKEIDFGIEVKGLRNRKWVGFVKISDVKDNFDFVGFPVKL